MYVVFVNIIVWLDFCTFLQKPFNLSHRQFKLHKDLFKLDKINGRHGFV